MNRRSILQSALALTGLGVVERGETVLGFDPALHLGEDGQFYQPTTGMIWTNCLTGKWCVKMDDGRVFRGERTTHEQYWNVMSRAMAKEVMA